jgi:hypothetical protein
MKADVPNRAFCGLQLHVAVLELGSSQNQNRVRELQPAAWLENNYGQKTEIRHGAENGAERQPDGLPLNLCLI